MRAYQKHKIYLSSKRTLPLCLLSWFILILSQFPGVFSPASILIISQGSGLAPKSNWHSPVLREIWSVISLHGAHPVWIFLVQSIIYVLSLYLLLSIQESRNKALLVFLSFTNPITLNIVGYVGTDAWIFLITLLGYAIFFYNKRKSKSLNRLTSWTLILIFVLISTFRVNALLIFIPLIWLTSKNLPNSRTVNASRLKPLITICFLLLIFLASSFLNSVSAGRDLSPQNTLLLWDSVGIAVNSSNNDIPDDYQRSPKCTLVELENQYSARTGDPLFWGEAACMKIALPEDYKSQDIYFSKNNEFSEPFAYTSWISSIIKNPFAYLKHRINVASNLLGIQHPPTGMFIESSAPSAVQIKIDPSFRNQFHTSLYKVLNMFEIIHVFFLPVIWIILLVFMNRSTTENFSMWVLTYTASMLILAPGTDLRYLYPIWGFVILACANLKNSEQKTK